MLHTKKQRHKPLYKQFVRLRKNVQNRRILRIRRNKFFPNKPTYTFKTLIIKFKKQKWKGFISYLEKILKYRKRSFRMYNIKLYNIQRFPNYLKKKYSNKIQVKKSLSLFYGGLLEKYLKKQINISLKKTVYSRKNFGSINLFLIKILESRLDTILYRSFFTLSIRSARQLITHGHVFVNKKVIKTNSFILKKGDLIEVNPKYHKSINANIQRSFIWPLPPKYLLINFRTFQIFFNNNIESTNFSIHFPFWVDINTLIKYYR
jgi:small subunit ribosomal protein S4